jgi:predicted ATPase
VDLAAFAKRAFDLAVLDRARAIEDAQWIFFDRGLVDASVALQHATGRPSSTTLGPFDRYYHRVFLTPPWPEIYVKDRARQHSMEEAISEYERLFAAYKELGYEPIILPKISVAERANFLLSFLR